jgi:hypothetical protein
MGNAHTLTGEELTVLAEVVHEEVHRPCPSSIGKRQFVSARHMVGGTYNTEVTAVPANADHYR